MGTLLETDQSTTNLGYFRISNELLQDADALRSRGEEDGYLFFKGLIAVEAIERVRQDLLNVVNAYGWLAQGRPINEGIIDVEALNRVLESEMRTDIGVSRRAYDDVQKLESVHRLPHYPGLLDLYRVLFGGDVLVHPRHIIRMITPHSSMVPTPIHQDFPLIQGSPQTWTCWFPLGDCTDDLGGLSILPRSHRLGCLPIQPTGGAGGIAAQLCPGESGWISGGFEAGDVLTFPSFTVHKGRPCRFPDRIRLSMDARYQAVDDVIEEKSLMPHCEMTWDEIYSGWEGDDFKYYWQRSRQRLVPWDDSLQQPAQRIC